VSSVPDQLAQAGVLDRATRRVRRVPGKRYLVIIPVLLLLWAGASGLSQVNMFLVASVLLACIGAIALNLLMGTLGQVSLGTAAFLAIGAFGAYALLAAGVPFPLDVVGASLAAGIIGILFGLPALRLRGLYLALATLAAYFVVFYFVDLYQEHSPYGSGFLIQPLFSSFGSEASLQYWCGLLLVIVAVEVVAAAHLSAGRAGRAWRVVRDHEAAAPALGINVLRVKLTTFALTSCLMGLQGALTFHLTGSVSDDQFTFALSVSYLAMIVIGGLDSVAGAIIGAAIVVLLPTLVPELIARIAPSSAAVSQGPALAEIAYGALLVIFIVIAPDGIVGRLRLSYRRLPPWASAFRPRNTPAAREPAAATAAEDSPS
jgi:branched-chain amino acid transport system permease protein